MADYIIFITGATYILAIYGLYSIFSYLVHKNKTLSKIWFIIKVKVFRSKISEKKVKVEKEKSKEYKYETFDDFLRDCPEYQIDDSFLGRIIRNIYASFGAKYRSFVFIDPKSPEDRIAWLRVEGESVLHEKGTYALAAETVKKINYYKLNDFRPLIDLANDPDWRDAEAVADTVTGLVNTANMNALDKATNGDQNPKYTIIIMGAVILTLITVIVMIYYQDKNFKESIELLSKIVQYTKPIGT